MIGRPPGRVKSAGAILYTRLAMLRWLLTILALGGAAPAAGAGDLAPGLEAPGFVLIGTDGREYRLADFVGKQGLVLAWFPRAFTSG
jgi:peroxiredoxin Q/BCP